MARAKSLNSSATSKKGGGLRVIARNKKAYYTYQVLEEMEAGIVLMGSELKPLRQAAANLLGSYGRVTLEGEVVALNIHIKAYQASSYSNHEPTRTRKLLLRKKQIRKLIGKLKMTGYTLIPLELYFKDSLVKVKLGLCVGKKLHDKRNVLKDRDVKRNVERYMKTRYLRS